MNWQAIIAVSEALGAIGVILSLLYLAKQIQQNTRVQRRTNVGDIAADLAGTLRTVTCDAETSELVLRALSDLASLDAAERYRFDCFFYLWLAAFERALIDARDGEYPQEYMVPLRSGVAGFLRTPGGQAWWEQRKAWFTPYGRRCISEILSDREIEHSESGPPIE